MGTIRIGAGQGVVGEAPELMLPVFESGVDYVVCDALAETTCAGFALDRQADESQGAAPDLPARLDVALPLLKSHGTRFITNAGGLNTIAAHQRAVAQARALGLHGLRIGVVHHDPPPDPSTDGTTTVATVAYAGAAGIVDALAQGADVVITGRVADASLFLAPLIHEHGWAWDDWDALAAGIAVGHLLECSGQCTGGTYSGDWWNTVDYRHCGLPIAEVDSDGSAMITKPADTGGRISFDTVREQLLYEVHDPSRYLTPDVVADFTTATLDELGGDRVRLSGVTGTDRPEQIKALRYSIGGWSAEIALTFSWPDAEAKCRHVLRSLRETAEHEGIEVLEWYEEYFGIGGFGGPTVRGDAKPHDPPEVTGRLVWRCATPQLAGAVQRLVGRIGLFSPPGLQGIGRRPRNGRAAPEPLLRLEPYFLDRDVVERTCRVVVEEV